MSGLSALHYLRDYRIIASNAEHLGAKRSQRGCALASERPTTLRAALLADGLQAHERIEAEGNLG